MDILKSYFNNPFINSDGKRRAKQLNNFPWAVSVDSVLDIGENPRHGIKVNSRHQWSSSNGPASCHHVEMGGYQTIWFYQLSSQCKLATVRDSKADVSSVSPSLDSLRRKANARNVSFRISYGGQFTLSTQLIKPNYLVILPPTQHHSFFRNLAPLFV